MTISFVKSATRYSLNNDYALMGSSIRILLIVHFIMSAGVIKFLVFSALALYDIYYTTETDLTQEWVMVEVTGGLVLFYAVASFVMLIFFFKRAKRQAEPGNQMKLIETIGEGGVS
jgi:hypothetical protein